MQKPLQFIASFLLITFYSFLCHAQKVELSAGVAGNLYNYTGSATDDAVFGLNSYYNKNLRFGYGGNLQLNWVSKKGLIAGVQSGFDALQNKQQFGYYIDLSTVQIASGYPTGRYSFRGFTQPASAYEITDLKMVNVNPYIGFRIVQKRFKLDIIAGAEAAYNIKYHIVNNNSDGSNSLIFQSNSPKQQADYRLKGGLVLNYKKTAINLTYAHGLTNFLKGETYVGPYGKPTFPASAYSQLIKLGLNYRIY